MDHHPGQPDGKGDHERTWAPTRAGGTSSSGGAAPETPPDVTPAPAAAPDADPPTWPPTRRSGSALRRLTAPPDPVVPSSRLNQASRRPPRTGPTGPECDRPQLPQEGEDVLGFRLGSVLGQGSFARVFLAEQTDLGRRQVALKVSDLS